MRRVALTFAFLLALAGCAGGMKVNPGAVVEKSTEGPDGTTTTRAFYGAQVAEFTGGERANRDIADGIKSIKKKGDDAADSVSRTSNIVAASVLAALVAFIAFLVFKARR